MSRIHRALFALCTLSLVVLWAEAASAHVTVDPGSAPKGAGDQTLVFRVPNEQAGANTVGVRVQFPADHPIGVVSPLQMPGWTATVKKVTLPTPIKTDDGTMTEVVSEVDWTGGKISADNFGQFTVLAQGLPSDTDTLTFKTIQNYDNGQDVKWIEVADASNPNPGHPAPQLKLTAAESTQSSPSTTTARTPGTAADGDPIPTTTSGTTSATTGGGSTIKSPVVTAKDGDVISSGTSGGVATALADQINSSDASKTQVNIAIAMAGFAILLAGVAIFVARAKP